MSARRSDNLLSQVCFCHPFSAGCPSSSAAWPGRGRRHAARLRLEHEPVQTSRTFAKAGRDLAAFFTAGGFTLLAAAEVFFTAAFSAATRFWRPPFCLTAGFFTGAFSPPQPSWHDRLHSRARSICPRLPSRPRARSHGHGHVRRTANPIALRVPASAHSPCRLHHHHCRRLVARSDVAHVERQVEVQRVLPRLADRHRRHVGTERCKPLLDLPLVRPMEHPHLARVRHQGPQLRLGRLHVLVVKQHMRTGPGGSRRRDARNRHASAGTSTHCAPAWPDRLLDVDLAVVGHLQ